MSVNVPERRAGASVLAGLSELPDHGPMTYVDSPTTAGGRTSRHR